MTPRPWIAHASPVAFVAGMLLVHCSSSSAPVTGGVDSGQAQTNDGSTGGNHDSGSAPSKDSGGGVKDAGGTFDSGAGSDSGTTKDSGASKDTGVVEDSGTGTLTDTHDAGPCIGPAGGEACDPGNIECGTSQCAVPGNECCNGTDGTLSCLSVVKTCAGNQQACDEKSDCPDGQICCLKVTDFSGDFTISCVTGTTCPSDVAAAQVCKTNAECPGGACTLYTCQGQVTEACSAPSPICTSM
jgi:hypothetical protein